ncbi:uncharacterized protein F5891DRAFT_1063553 [Suillus fuscotomentosus]|uniref:Uncharacterized protein n=1 Tax=Suillus fuscotomentosus TaxID=1912939 RepID=A0AAD4DX00_9AGAM|nr:uncharacterized protein F5891DRAFT_1063553 [Suillus fuscotomentosus]KAG1894153.1 hypothetical protein F5891DRAFT_1063553 [Suillus fuscotomentosus]
MALTPSCTILYLTSCIIHISLRSASVTLSVAPVGYFPLQKISADDAARGHTIGSIFWGPDCSLHRICSPADCPERSI